MPRAGTATKVGLCRLVLLLLGALLPLLLALQQGPETAPDTTETVRALVQNLKADNPYVREHAARMLGRMGPEAAEAVPALIEALSQGRRGHFALWTNAIWALGEIGADPGQLVPALLPFVGRLRADEWGWIRLGDVQLEPNDLPRTFCIVWRADLPEGPDAWLMLPEKVIVGMGEAAVPALVRAVEDRTSPLRDGAAFVLGLMGEKAESAVPALIRLLNDHDWQVRRTAASALGRIGPKAGAAVPVFMEMMGYNSELDMAVRWSLAQIEPGRQELAGAPAEGPPETETGVWQEPARTLEELLQALRRKYGDVQWRAALELGQMGESAVGGVMPLLEDENARVRRWAAMALGEIGPAAKRAAPLLRKAMLEDTDGEVRETAVWAVGAVGGQSAIPVLSGALEHWDPRVRELAVNSLRGLDADAAAAVPALRSALSCSDPNVRKWAAIALKEKAPRDRDTIRSLAAALADRDHDVRLEAAHALQAAGPAAKEAEPALVERLSKPRKFDEREWSVARAAALALQAIGPDADKHVPGLLNQLARGDTEAQAAAAVALGGFSNAARAVVPALTEALRDDNADVRVSAASALEVLGRAVEAAEPALAQALRDKDARVAEAAAWALRAIFPGPLEREWVWRAHEWWPVAGLRVHEDTFSPDDGAPVQHP